MKKVGILLLCCMFILKSVYGQSPCLSSNSYGSCISQCSLLPPGEDGFCFAACAACYLDNGSSSGNNIVCSNGSPACKGYTSYCYYASNKLYFCGPCPGVTTCGIKPPKVKNRHVPVRKHVPKQKHVPVRKHIKKG